MLYVVLMPVKPDNVRRLTMIHAQGFTDVQELLHLPQGWLSWVSFTDAEVELIFESEHNSICKMILKG